MKKASGIIPSIISNNEELNYLRFFLADKLHDLKDNPKDKDALEELLTGIDTTEMFHPTLPASGAFSNVRNNFRDVKELLERGYLGRSLIPTAKTLLSALASPVTEPIRLLNRIVSGYNPSYMTTEEIRKEKDPDKIYNAAAEHIHDLFFEREDPANYALPNENQLSREEYIQKRLPYMDFDLDDLDDLNDTIEDEDMKKESSANIVGLLKAADLKRLEYRTEEQQDAIEKTLALKDSYLSNPTDENKTKLIEALTHAENLHPFTATRRFMGVVRDNIKDTAEMWERGNKIRSILPASKLLLTAPGSLLVEPARMLGRAINPNLTFTYKNTKDLEKNLNKKTIEKIVNEHIGDLDMERADPARTIKDLTLSDMMAALLGVRGIIMGNPLRLVPAVIHGSNIAANTIGSALGINGIDRDTYAAMKMSEKENSTKSK